jgi:hypothetical protein
MSTSDDVFLAAGGSVAEVAEWVGVVLGLVAVADPELKDGEYLFRTTGGDVGIVVSANKFVELDPEPDEVQAMDGYPIELSVRLVGSKDEELQLRETRSIFDHLAAARPDVPMLLVHNLDTLVSAHLPGVGTHTFEPSISPDAPDLETWSSWVRG